MTTFQGRISDYPIDALFLERWSPRAFTGEPLDRETLLTLFEAARWAPSSSNLQPWRFVYGLLGTPEFTRILGLLMPGNQSWAKNACALVVAISKSTRMQGATEVPSYTHSFDAGAAWQNISLQAVKMGYHTHGMAGVDFKRAAQELEVPEGYRVEMAFAVGKQADKATLTAELQAREVANGRNSVISFVFEGVFSEK